MIPGAKVGDKVLWHVAIRRPTPFSLGQCLAPQQAARLPDVERHFVRGVVTCAGEQYVMVHFDDPLMPDDVRGKVLAFRAETDELHFDR